MSQEIGRPERERDRTGWLVKPSEHAHRLSSPSYTGVVCGAPQTITTETSRLLTTDHHDRCDVMKKFEILCELPKCDVETGSEQMVLGKQCG